MIINGTYIPDSVYQQIVSQIQNQQNPAGTISPIANQITNPNVIQPPIDPSIPNPPPPVGPQVAPQSLGGVAQGQANNYVDPMSILPPAATSLGVPLGGNGTANGLGGVAGGQANNYVDPMSILPPAPQTLNPSAVVNLPPQRQQAPNTNAPQQGPQFWGPPSDSRAPLGAPPGPSAMPQARSVEQTVQNSSPQSVSNFLTALNKVGAGSNNAQFGQAGQAGLGQGAQAGFQGFGQNGYGSYVQPTTWQGYAGPAQSGIQNAFNSATQAANVAPAAPVIGQNTGDQGQGGNSWNRDAHNINYAQGTPINDLNKSPTGQGISPSDIACKTDIKSGKTDMENFLDSLGVYSYEYKNKEYGEGRRISPMAQEIESTPLGKDAVSINKDGFKQVDYGKLLGTMLSGIAMVNHKTNALESFKKDILQEMRDLRSKKSRK